METSFLIAIGSFLGLLALPVLFCTIAYTCWLYKVGPHQALLVYGAKGTRVIVGGSILAPPFLYRVQYFSLETMPFELLFALNSTLDRENVLRLQANTLIKVGNEEQSIIIAAQQFLGKSQQEREHLIHLVMEGHLHETIDQWEGEELLRNLKGVKAQALEAISADLDKMGLEMVSFTLREIR
jgi:flotillin